MWWTILARVAVYSCLATASLAEEVSIGLGLRVAQAGVAVPIEVHRTNGLFVPPQFVRMQAAPFTLVLSPSKCAGLERSVFVRAVPAEGLNAVVEHVDASARFADRLEGLFPPAGGYAAHPDVPQTQLWASTALPEGEDWPYNYFFGHRFALLAAVGDRIDVAKVLAAPDGPDWLAQGRPFLLMVARAMCDDRPGHFGIDLISISFGDGAAKMP